MRTLAVLVAGLALGSVVTFGVVIAGGGWYTYRTLSASDCKYAEEIIGATYEVVPHQPNPCHFRRQRWRWP